MGSFQRGFPETGGSTTRADCFALFYIVLLLGFRLPAIGASATKPPTKPNSNQGQAGGLFLFLIVWVWLEVGCHPFVLDQFVSHVRGFLSILNAWAKGLIDPEGTHNWKVHFGGSSENGGFLGPVRAPIALSGPDCAVGPRSGLRTGTVVGCTLPGLRSGPNKKELLGIPCYPPRDPSLDCSPQPHSDHWPFRVFKRVWVLEGHQRGSCFREICE